MGRAANRRDALVRSVDGQFGCPLTRMGLCGVQLEAPARYRLPALSAGHETGFASGAGARQEVFSLVGVSVFTGLAFPMWVGSAEPEWGDQVLSGRGRVVRRAGSARAASGGLGLNCGQARRGDRNAYTSVPARLPAQASRKEVRTEKNIVM